MRKILLMLVVAATIINLVYWFARDNDTPSAAGQNDVTQTTHDDAATPTESTRTVELLDVPIAIGAGGDLVVTPRVRQLFDKIASRNNEEPVDNWKHQILQPFSADIPATALIQLQDAFDRFVEFNLALQLLPMEGPPNLQAVLQRVQTLRAHYLGQYADPMYQDWQTLEDFTHQYLTLMTQQRDDSATLDALEQQASQLPEPVQQRALNMIRRSAEYFAVDDMASLNPDAYARMLQEQAAVTLIETTLVFDEPSAEFMARYEQYNEKKRDLVLSDVSEDEQQAQLAELRRQYFNGSDILRVETLDRAEAY